MGSSRYANYQTFIRKRASDYFAPRQRIKLGHHWIDALKDHLAPEAVAAFRGANIYSLGGERGVASMLEEAGFIDVGVVTERLEIDLPPMAEFFPKMIATTPYAPIFEALPYGEKKAVIEHMRGSVSERAGGHGAIAHMTAVVAGARPTEQFPESRGAMLGCLTAFQSPSTISIANDCGFLGHPHPIWEMSL